MQIYQPRSIRFIELFHHSEWTIKIYSISVSQEFVKQKNIEKAKKQLEQWLSLSNMNTLTTYQVATLIIHEGKEGCFAIINWWIDDNMLQQYVYLANHEEEPFQLYSSNGIVTCVWELSVIWFERNVWVQHVLVENPNFQAYLQCQLNQD
jgi:hypothetical protein